MKQQQRRTSIWFKPKKGVRAGNSPVWKGVTNMNTLKSLQKAGKIELHEDTGQEVESQGIKRKAHYVKSYNKPEFEHKGRKFKAQYEDGSFNPYVYEDVDDED